MYVGGELEWVLLTVCFVVQSDAANDGDVFRREGAEELLHFVFLACLLRFDKRRTVEYFDL